MCEPGGATRSTHLHHLLGIIVPVCVLHFLLLAALNDAGETLSPRNTYDKLYMYRGIISAIQEKTGDSGVTGEQIAQEFTDVRI